MIIFPVLFVCISAGIIAGLLYTWAAEWFETRKKEIADELQQVKRASRPPVHEGNLFYVMWGSFTVLFLAGYWLSASFLFSLICGISGLFIPRLYLRRWMQKRRERLEQQLPEVIRAISGGLRAGRSLQMVVESASKNFPEPARSEFTLASIQMKLGAPPEDAFREMAERTESEDLTLFASAVESARRAGGNLSQVLDELADVIQRRLEVRGKVRALSAQGRAQAWVMGFMPVFMLFILYFLDPHMLSDAFSHPLGTALFMLAGIFEAGGIFIMRRILALEV